VRIDKGVERRLSRWAVGVRSSINIHVHAMRQYLEARLPRRGLSARRIVAEESDCDDRKQRASPRALRHP
jgi:hypothetical protein